jgi:excisionase family DNA binding protein
MAQRAVAKRSKPQRDRAFLQTRLVSLSRVAEALGVSVYTVRRFVSAGSLPVIRVGGKLMVSSNDVERAQREGIAKRKLPSVC